MSTAFLEQFTTAPVEGPSWLTAAREHAMASFQSSGIPTMRNEDWHFTNPAPIAEGAFGPMRPGAGRVTVQDPLVGRAGPAARPCMTRGSAVRGWCA